MLRSFKLLFFFLLSFSTVWSNNLNLGSTVKILDIKPGEVTLQLTVRWENSWRDSYNNDAAWIFFKYRTSGSDWLHLCPEDSVGVNDGYRVLSTQSDGQNVGFFLYRDDTGSGVSETSCFVKWRYPSWIKEAMFASNQVFIMAQGIEMVYIPFGAYSLGDEVSDNCFCGEDGKTPFSVNSPDDLDFRTTSSDLISLSEVYPNGYDGFYMMKYELSQEQYVSFLNNLTRDQQISLLGNRLTTLQKGDYLFGNASIASRRNGIIVSQAITTVKPAVFDNNLDGDDTYGGEADGQSLACNYLSVRDLLGYASWSGLRPVTELEYEKSCRRLLPQGAIPGVYAWGTATFSPMPGLTSETDGRREESPSSGNANANGSFGFAPGDGPVRCGSFSSIASSRETAGAGFSGVMEMSGNVSELCINTLPGITNRFDGSVHGSGTFNPDLWGGRLSASFFGSRGGGFSSIPDRLRVSDRAEMNGRFVNSDQRDSTVGFRMVRMLDRNKLSLYAGEISLSSTTVCSGVPFTINGIVIRYEWYKDGVLIPDARGKSLSYSSGIYNARTADAVYNFTRKAICAVGEVETTPVRITVPGKLELKLPAGITEVILDCGTGTSITASRLRPGTFHWKNSSTGIIDRTTSGVPSDSYTPSHKAFGYMAGLRKVRCVSEMDGCLDSMDIALRLEPSCFVSLSSDAINLKSSTDAGSVTATLCGSGKITWYYKDAGNVEKMLRSSSDVAANVYKPEYADFANSLGDKTVICRTTTGTETGCKDEKQFIVHVSAELSSGSIGGPAIACGGTAVSITNTSLPGVAGMSGLSFTYKWFKDGSAMPLVGETGADLLNYPIPANATANTVRHSFTRKAYCTAPAMESPLTAAVNIDVPGVLTVSPGALSLSSGVASGKATASRSLSGTFNWYYKSGVTETLINGPVSGTSAEYTPTHGHFANTVGEKTVICRSAITAPNGICTDTKEFAVTVTASLNPGTLTAPAVACGSATITGTASSCGIAGLTPAYEWSVSVNGGAASVISGQTGQNLSYNLPVNNTPSTINYAFTRKTTYTSGSGNSNTVTVQVPGAFTLSTTTVNLANGSASTITANRSMGTFTWLSGGTTVGSGPTYVPKHSDFGNALGNGKIITCRSNVTVGNGGGGCQQDVNLTVNVSATINAGAITVPATACSGAVIALGNQTNGLVNGVNVAPSYEWYVNGGKVGTGVSMNYTVPVNNTTNPVNYTVTRKALYAGATTTEVTKTVGVQGKVSISATSLSLSGASASGSSTATLAGGSFTWTYGSSSTGGATFTPTYKSIDYTTNVSQIKVTCTGTVNGCSSTAILTVNQAPLACSYGGYNGYAVGGLCWMSSNLNIPYGTINVNYQESSNGKLYTWETAKVCCPSGWRLPSQDEWNTWITTYGGLVGYKMKSINGWLSYNGVSGGGDNSVGFNGIPNDGGGVASWWSSTPASKEGVYSPDLEYYYNSLDGIRGIGSVSSVRCVR